ncbi:MAG: hypothetical protein MO846_00990 [Candidatus Devosia symbiotica]|nr:hypothetical protein [Candidatus Devosia symbiotica]
MLQIEFINGDDHDAPDDAPLTQRIAAGFDRIDHIIATVQIEVLIIAVPLRDEDFRRLKVA